jgi:hypothetical protein
MSLNTTPHVFVAGETVTAALLNVEINAAITGIQAAWNAHTPAWTASGTGPALGNGTLVGSYAQVGKTIRYRILLSFGSTTTFGTGTYSFTLPVAGAGGAGIVHGVVRGFNSGVAIFAGFSLSNVGGTTISAFLPTSGANCAVVQVGQLVPWTFKSGDTLALVGTYEAA